MTKTELVAILKAMRETADDNTALQGKELYPVWKSGIKVEVGQRYQYENKLYKVNEGQAHTTQSDWTPDITPAMWKVIDVEHAGTLEDPIPASANMEYTKGLYYIEDETIYLMNRQGMEDGEKVTLAYLPSQLIGHYFEIAA